MSRVQQITRKLLISSAGALLLLVLGSSMLSAQGDCRSERNEIPWAVPPAIASVDGDISKAAAGRVYIGDRLGTMQIWDLALGTLSGSKTLTAGNGLPAGVIGIWDIAATSSEGVVALVTYAESGSEWYGFIRSSDAGESWTFEKPAALQVDHFKSVEGVRMGSTDWTGNYWRAPLYEMEWLSDGMHGWAWGRQGIVRTTDGGATWEVAYEAAATASIGNAAYEPVWGLAMRSPTEGVAVIGNVVGSSFRSTTDGGKSWLTALNLAVLRLADVVHVGGEYRAIAFNRTEREDNSVFYTSKDGRSWETKIDLGKKVESEGVYATETIWPNRSTGFYILRQGEIWRTDDAGETWDLAQANDNQYDTVFWGDGTAVNGNFQPPFFPYAGYGQRTVLVRDDFGDPYLVQVLTDICTGEIRPYVPTWFVDKEYSSVSNRHAPTFSLSIAPNPVAKECRVTFSLKSGSLVSTQIVDARGVVVREGESALYGAGEGVIELDMSALPAGAYHVILQSEDGSESRPVVVSR